jgi:hypothetical protein
MTIGVWALKIISLLISKDLEKVNLLTFDNYQMTEVLSIGHSILRDYVETRDHKIYTWSILGEEEHYEVKRRTLHQSAERAKKTIDGWERMGATILSLDDGYVEVELRGIRHIVPVHERQTKTEAFGFTKKPK